MMIAKYNLFFAVILGLAAVSSSGYGQIYANFDGGNSTTEVDGFTGMAGEGWLAPWWQRANGNNSGQSYSVVSAAKADNPLTGGSGYHLAIHTTNHTPTSRGVVLGRRYDSYGSLALDRQHTVSMLLRYEGVLADLRELVVYDGFARSTNGTEDGLSLSNPSGSALTWGVRSQGSSWQVYDNGWVNSTLSLVSGDTYALTVVVDPAANRYQANIVNLDWDGESGGGVYESDWLSFGNKGETMGGTLTTYYRLDSEADGGFTQGELSIDSIAIIPELGHLAAVLGAFAAGMLLLLRRRVTGGSSLKA